MEHEAVLNQAGSMCWISCACGLSTPPVDIFAPHGWGDLIRVGLAHEEAANLVEV